MSGSTPEGAPRKDLPDPLESEKAPGAVLPTTEAVELPPGQFASIFPDPGQQAFLGSFANLRSAMSGMVRYSATRLDLVDSLRSAFPRSSPLWQDTTEDWMDDRVIGRLLQGKPTDTTYYLMFTEGGSGDPAFYIRSEPGGGRIGWEDADVLVIPDTGDAWIYQRTNSVFPKRKRIRLAPGVIEEVKVDRYEIGLRTVALNSFVLRRTLDDPAEVARVSAGDSIEVVAGVEPPRSESILLVRTRGGIEGWVKVPSQQCNFGVIKGICFLGD